MAEIMIKTYLRKKFLDAEVDWYFFPLYRCIQAKNGYVVVEEWRDGEWRSARISEREEFEAHFMEVSPTELTSLIEQLPDLDTNDSDYKNYWRSII